MSDSVDKICRDVYMEFAASQHEHVIKNPICEVCTKNPSVRINRWGPIKACCWECLGNEMRQYEEFCKEDENERNGSY